MQVCVTQWYNPHLACVCGLESNLQYHQERKSSHYTVVRVFTHKKNKYGAHYPFKLLNSSLYMLSIYGVCVRVCGFVIKKIAFNLVANFFLFRYFY